jgi:hypothetical protein
MGTFRIRLTANCLIFMKKAIEIKIKNDENTFFLDIKRF